jgi:tRNA(Ile)-lysidine synthase
VDHFVRDLITEWRSLAIPPNESTLVAAVSGGADSVSLLLALDELIKRKKLTYRLVAAHFNHGLRDGASDADEEFVRSLASARQIELAVAKAHLTDKGNVEQNARRSRYDFLRRTAASVGAFAVVTGHTINDQAETVLMNLLRGSGPEGLAGMLPVRPLHDERAGEAEAAQAVDTPELPFPASVLLIRPLINWAKRSDTEAYCHHLGIEYRYDTMNEDTAFKRVRIRKILLPLLQDFNPKIVETLGNTAKVMRSVVQNGIFTDEHAASDSLQIARLKGLSEGEMSAAVRSWLRNRRGNTRQLELKHIEAIGRLVTSQKSGRYAEVPGGRVVKTGGCLIYEDNKVENGEGAV